MGYITIENKHGMHNYLKIYCKGYDKVYIYIMVV